MLLLECGLAVGYVGELERCSFAVIKLVCVIFLILSRVFEHPMEIVR